MTKHIQIKIQGQVQGVCFRYCMQERARELGVAGFVCNKPDGMVYVEAEGGEGKLKELVKWCHHGPEQAKVDKVEVKRLEELKNFEDFTIKYYQY